MPVPPHVRDIDPPEIASILARAPLACIVAQTDQGLVANPIRCWPRPTAR